MGVRRLCFYFFCILVLCVLYHMSFVTEWRGGKNGEEGEGEGEERVP